VQRQKIFLRHRCAQMGGWY